MIRSLSLIAAGFAVATAATLCYAGPLEDAQAAYEKLDFAAALTLWRPQAESGNAEAQNGLGKLYMYGQGVTKDPAEGIKWLKKSAGQGYAKGQANLAYAYMEGNGLKQDYGEAAKWYRMAAEQGDIESQVSLGRMYGSGDGVQENPVEAAKWFRMAAEQGNAEAELETGKYYLTGAGGEKNLEAAKRWLTSAKEKGLGYADSLLDQLPKAPVAPPKKEVRQNEIITGAFGLKFGDKYRAATVWEDKSTYDGPFYKVGPPQPSVHFDEYRVWTTPATNRIYRIRALGKMRSSEMGRLSLDCGIKLHEIKPILARKYDGGEMDSVGEHGFHDAQDNTIGIRCWDTKIGNTVVSSTLIIEYVSKKLRIAALDEQDALTKSKPAKAEKDKF